MEVIGTFSCSFGGGECLKVLEAVVNRNSAAVRDSVTHFGLEILMHTGSLAMQLILQLLDELFLLLELCGQSDTHRHGQLINRHLSYYKPCS